MKYFGDIELIEGKILNLIGEKVSSDPTVVAAEEGRIIYNTTEKAYKYNNGSAYVAFEVSVTTNDALIDTLGSNWINNDFSFDPTPYNNFDNVSSLTANDSLFNVLDQLDTAITNALSVNKIDGIDVDTSGIQNQDILMFDGSDFIAASIDDLGTPTLDFSEINDTNFTGLANNDIVVYDSGNSEWQNRQWWFKYENFAANTTFVVTHNLNSQYCHVTVINASDDTIITPSDITFTDANNLTVQLGSSNPVIIIVTALGN